MKKFVSLVLLSAGLAAACLAGSGFDRGQIRDEETTRRTLNLSGPSTRVVVDNLEGYVHLTGTNGSQVLVVAHRSIRAETQSDLNQAKSEVSLQMSELPGSVSVYYDAPWRCNSGEARACHDNQRRFYSVTYDIDIEIPRRARTVISTVNNGDITLTQMDGNFEVSNVNGGINMVAVSGSGEVRTVNGGLTIHFARNPSQATTFKTVNGQIDVSLQPQLSADLLFKTFNGEVYSDFDVTPKALPAVATEQHGGRFVYHSKGQGAGRVGRGGPELSFETLNGSIRLHQEK